MQIQTLDDIRHIKTGSFIPGGVLGSKPEEKGTVLGPDGKPITSDDINCILDSRKNPITGKHYRLQGWSNENKGQTVNQESKNQGDKKNSKKSYKGIAKAILNPKTLLLGGLAMIIAGNNNCKSPSSPDNGNGNGNEKINIAFTVYNHTQGQLGTFTASELDTGGFYDISMDYIRNRGIDLSTVDDMRMAIREYNFGNLLYKTTNGTITIQAPGGDATWDIFLFNNQNGAPYQYMDEQNSGLYLNKHNFVVYRRDFDGQTGPEKVWTGSSLPELGNQAGGVWTQLNQALKPEGVPFTYGQIQVQDDGDFSYGYGDSNGAEGWHAGSYITINAERIGDDRNAMKAFGLEEAFENITSVDNIGGTSSLVNIQLEGILTGKGKDLFTYTFVMN